jgi:hypothetical protein
MAIREELDGHRVGCGRLVTGGPVEDDAQEYQGKRTSRRLKNLRACSVVLE